MKRVPMVEMSHADFMRVIDVHVGGAFNCSKAVLPILSLKKAKATATAAPAAAKAAKIYFQLSPAANIMQQPMMP